MLNMMKNIFSNGMIHNITPLGFGYAMLTTDYNLFTPSALKYKLEI